MNNPFARIFRREVTLAEGLTGYNKDEKDSSTPNKGSSYRERIVQASTEDGALSVAAVFRAAELRANALASLRLQYLVRDEAHNFMRVDTFGHGRRLNYLLNVRPNARQNAFQFWKMAEMLRIFHGHAYILPVTDTMGQVGELVLCHGHWDMARNVYQLTETHTCRAHTAEADKVLVLRGIVTHNRPDGESVIRYAARTLAVSATSETLSLESAAKGGRQKLILQQKDSGAGGLMAGLDPKEMQKQAAKLQESIYNDDVIFDDSSSNITPINMSVADMQLLETRKFTVADIARFFGVPRALLMDDSNSNYRTAENGTLEFLSRTLTPLIREIESEFDGKLLTPEEYGVRQFRFDRSALFDLDLKTKSDYAKSRLETGLASVNELRAEENKPALPDGDEHFVSCNVAPLGSDKLSGRTAPKPLTQPTR